MGIGSREQAAAPDPKQGEREYFARIGEEGRRHSVAKPFSDEHCAQYLANVAALMELMPAPPARVVEFGCGTGWLGQMLALRGYSVLGIDISPDAIALAARSAAERGLANATYRVADYEDTPVNAAADVVIFHDALHHAEDEAAAMRAAFAALAPGGMTICIEPGEGHSTSASSRRAIAEFGVHEKDMPPPVIVRHARAAGFTRFAVLPLPAAHFRSVFRRDFGTSRPDRNPLGWRLLTLYRTIRLHFRSRRQGLVILYKD